VFPVYKAYVGIFFSWAQAAKRGWSCKLDNRPEVLEGVLAVRHLLAQPGCPASSSLDPAMLPGSPIDVRWRGDASTVFGHGFLCPTAGFYFSEKWTENELAAFSRGRESPSSTLAEAECMLRGATMCMSKGLNVGETDSQPLADAWARGYSQVNDVNIVLRKLRTLTTMRGAIFQIRHVLRAHNWAADKLSKGEPIHDVLTYARAEFPGHTFRKYRPGRRT
jgi:hypothetical protein